MSDETIRRLEQQIRDLNGENAVLKKEAKDRRIAGKKLRSEAEELRAKLASAEGERDRLKSSPNELAAEVDRLRGEIRTSKHRARFDVLADAAKILPQAREDLWGLLGYKADTDEPDDNAIKSAIAEKVKTRSYMVAAEGATPEATAQPGETTAPQLPALPAGPGGQRGEPAPNRGQFVVTKAQLQSPAWSLDPANQKAVSEASANGTLVIK